MRLYLEQLSNKKNSVTQVLSGNWENWFPVKAYSNIVFFLTEGMFPSPLENTKTKRAEITHQLDYFLLVAHDG